MGWLELVIFIAGALVLAVGVMRWASNEHDRSLVRVDGLVEPAEAEVTRPAPLRTFPPRYPWLAPAAGLGVAAAVGLFLKVPFAIGAGALAGVAAYLIERGVADARGARIEQQLADALDLMIGALRAGASIARSLEAALEAARNPLRRYLEEVIARLRLGDAPDVVLRDLAARVPMETFRLFALTLAVHWEVGGSLSATLAVVARTIRDRVELGRRVRAQGVEAYFSVAVVFLLAYAIGFLMWRANPDRTARFFMSDVGAEMTGAVILLQAVGLFWMSRLSRIDY